MSIVDKASKYKDFVQSSFENAMNTVESIHQTCVEMPIDMLRQVGYPDEKADQIKKTHRELLKILYTGIRSAHNELGNLVVKQVGQLAGMAPGLAPMKPPVTRTPPVAAAQLSSVQPKPP